jgi:hypothetical protein
VEPVVCAVFKRDQASYVQWRRDCAAKVGLGFTLPTEEEQPLMDKSGQVFEDERQEEVAA